MTHTLPLLFAASLAGLAVPARPQPAPARPQPAPARPQPAPARPAPTAAQAAPAQTLTLGQATDLVLGSSPAVTAARQTLAQAQARVGQAQAARRLQITFNSTASLSNASVYQPPPDQETFGTLQNTLTVPLPLGARGGLLVRSAQDQFLSARAQFGAARLALAGQVAAAYYDLLRKQALLAVAQQTLDQDRRALADARKREAAGDVARLDVLQAQVPVAAAQAALDGAENDLDVAREALNSLLGRPLDDPLDIADVSSPAADFLPATLAQARALALARSPDILAADATVRADESSLAAARLYREPSVSLQAIDIRSKDVTSFSREDTLQAAVTVPLTDGGLGREQVREAEAALAGARAQAQTSRRSALAAVSAAFLTARSRRRQLAAARVTLDIARITYDKTVQGYQKGLFPLLQVLNAQAALTQARIAYTQGVYDAAASGSALSTALQGEPPAAGLSPGAAPAPPAPVPAAPAGGNGTTGNGGTSPAGAGGPGVSPAGGSTTGTGAGAGGAGGRGNP
jgi:outer membrane protein TolC